MTTDQGIILLILIINFIWLQTNVCVIGNRQYSMHYESHHLVERKGICKLIYFRPKHFHRYSIWEVLAFFFSYIETIIIGILLLLSLYFDIGKGSKIVAIIFLASSLFFEATRIIYIDISRKIEEKNINYKLESYIEDKNVKNKKALNAVLSYSQTIRCKLDLLYNNKLEGCNGNKELIDIIDNEFIRYYQNYKEISIADGKVVYTRFVNATNIRYEILCSFDSKKRTSFPDLNSKTYRPHFVIKGDKLYMGIEFESSDLNEFNKEGKAIVRSLYDESLYKDLLPGVSFSIREGTTIVGNGKILTILN